MIDNKYKMEKCKEFFDNLSVLLWSTHNTMGSCNRDASAYLVPIGTENLVTYKSKPKDSFRISDHWNWYANTKKNADVNYVQCNSVDLPKPTSRLSPNKASKPIFGCQVAIFCDDEKYHCVYGDCFDERNNTWNWIESDPQIVADRLLRGE